MSGSRDEPDALCRLAYRQIDRECRRQGLDAAKIEESRGRLSRRVGATCVLHERAYEPTGVALGCPLPDRHLVRRLRRVARLFARLLAEGVASEEPVFAFVPPDRYHVTIVNNRHFDTDTTSEMTGEDWFLSPEKRAVAERAAGRPGTIRLQLHGLVLTRSGRLLACGFPCQDRLYELRRRIVAALPDTRHKLPPHASIKLGHVRVAPAGESLPRLLDGLRRLGQGASGRLVFTDAYTPAGRFPLVEDADP